jgi:hypothetical protein
VITAAGAWWTLLGWDTQKTLGSDGYQHGPYERWQVIALTVVMSVLAVWLGYRHNVLGGPATAAITLALCFGVSGELDPENDGLWPVGAIMLAFASFVGIALLAHLSRRIDDRFASRR